MKLAKKTIVMIISLALIFSVSVFGTIAYLTDKAEVVNTFSVGDVSITVDESKVDKDGNPVDNDNDGVFDRTDDVDNTNDYHMVPGKEYTKDPTMTVKANSEPSYVRMMVKFNNYTELQTVFENAFSPDKFYTADAAWTLQNAAGVVNTEKDTVTFEYRYKNAVATAEADQKLEPVFSTFTVPGELDGEDLKAINKDGSLQITVEGHAIQTATFADEAAAWAAFDNQMNPGVNP